MVGDFIIRKHSARTLALLVRSHTRFTRTLARTLPLVARGDARTAIRHTRSRSTCGPEYSKQYRKRIR